MKKLTLLIVLACIIQATSISQSCLPDGIIFTTQAQIDSFQINYPNCTEIEGRVVIGKYLGSDITNLNGLISLTSIMRYLRIRENYLLKNLNGLGNLELIGENLQINNNDSLYSLVGLDKLKSIGTNLEIVDNPILYSLEGLDNLVTIGGDLWIRSNQALNDITSLVNLDANSIQDVYIFGNKTLSDCEALSLCDYLSNPAGAVNIYNNAPGCNNPGEIAANCGFELACLPFGNYHFTSQTEIDHYQQNYPGCDSLKGTVNISGNDITNLYGLSVLTSVWGNLNISWNDSLTTLTGLENLTSIDGSLTIGYYFIGNPSLKNIEGLNNLTHIGGDLDIHSNPLLTSLSGLESLVSVGGNFYIGNCWAKTNPNEDRNNGNSSLKSLTGLENLVSVGEMFSIQCNDSLTSLKGLEKLESVGGLSIWEEISSLNEFGNLSYIGEYGLSVVGTDITSFEGLENVTSTVGHLGIRNNDNLTSLTGLEMITSIGGFIDITGNDSLTSLTGLENIDVGLISSLHISNNSTLSTCEVQSICNYLAAPNGDIIIYDNAPGCNSLEEVLDSCDFSSLADYGLLQSVSVHPNPFSTSTTIAYDLQQSVTVQITIFNHLGQRVDVIREKQSSGMQQIVWDADGLSPGIYYCQLKINEAVVVIKLLKLK